MKYKVLDLFLVIVVLIGGILAWQTGRERSRLSREHARLARITGDLPVEDPSRVHVLALETDAPMHFAWRVYFPPGYTQIVSAENYSTLGPSWRRDSTEFLARVVFREDNEGRLQVYTRFSGGSSQMSFGDRALAAFLHGRWDKIRVEQLGAPALAVLGPNQTATLLRLTLPEDLQAEARKTLPSHSYGLEADIPVLLELKLGPNASKP